MLKFIYYGITLVLCFPIIIWNALVSIIMYDAKYFDGCMQHVADFMNIVDNPDSKPSKF